MGQFDPKNLERLIAAYRLMLAQTPDADFDLVLPGRLGWDYQRILAAGNDARRRSRFH